MTPIVATAAVISGVPTAIAIIGSIVRWVRPYADAPRLCERNAQDGPSEGGEGVGFVTHINPTKTIVEQDHAR